MWSWHLARVSNIDIKVHASFLLVLLFGALQWGGFGLEGAVFGAVLTVLVFASVTLHELGHSLVAQAFGIPVKDITLYPIGGVAQLSRRPKTPGQEFLIALAGPAVNVVLAMLLSLVGIWVYGGDALLSAVAHARSEHPSFITLLAMLISSNVVLAVFNMVPALPMDGGRVLRAVLSWWLGQDTATRISAVVARVLAVGLFVLGFFVNPMLSFIALVVFTGAGQEVKEQQLARVLDGVRASDAVNPYSPRFTPATTLGDAIATLAATHWDAFAVEHFGRLVGVVTRDDLLGAAREHGAFGYVASCMRRNVDIIGGHEPLENVRFKFAHSGVPFVAVVSNGMFLGLITELDLALITDRLARTPFRTLQRGPVPRPG